MGTAPLIYLEKMAKALAQECGDNSECGPKFYCDLLVNMCENCTKRCLQNTGIWECKRHCPGM